MADFPWWAFFLPRSYEDLKKKEEEKRKRDIDLINAYGGPKSYAETPGVNIAEAIRAVGSMLGQPKSWIPPQQTLQVPTSPIGELKPAAPGLPPEPSTGF